ncbi:hypothetical protein WH47_01383 [Habropoda laboriosa]|uniref:Uncharacterized protein n=1 Tax=Habropoda laboriosa TaxID=597456 RepID=A0A0L7QJU8_9HYME|nr:hypothetical protein WH47_01383 [Habropoda laboriosa]
MNRITRMVLKERKNHLSILSPAFEVHTGVFTLAGTCNFGMRRVNTDVSLDNNIPVGSKA